MVCQWYPDTTLTFVNERFCEFFGKKREDLVGTKWLSLIPEDTREAASKLCKSFEENPQIFASESEVIGADGKIYWKEWISCPIRDGQGQVIEFQSVGRDITERINLERDLEEERKNLEKTVESRTKELRETLDKLEGINLCLEEANRHKSKFLSSMSHELRTPLNAIIGFTDLLKGIFFGQLNEKQASYIEQIDKSAAHLLALINDLLDISKIDAGALEVQLEEITLKDVTEDLLRMLSTQFRKKTLKVTSEFSPDIGTIVSDSRKFKQIMLNLLTNAIKFTPDKGAISVKGEMIPGKIKISVSDTGIGIAGEELGKIFSEFYQVDQVRDEELGGTGIGLALTQRLVGLLGGEIGVKSKIGKGSTFWFTIPYTPSIHKEKIEISNQQKRELDISKRKYCILVVEDNETNINLFSDLLSIRDYSVIVARNGQEAIDMALSRGPELILMDIKMPVMDGLEATRQLRKKEQFKDVPIIALTASVGKEAEQIAFDTGYTDYLSKPVKMKQLFDMLDKYLK